MQAVCLVIPCYNEGERLDLPEIAEFLKRFGDYHFCFVDDGSDDRTDSILRSFTNDWPDRTTLFSYRDNCGKAEAVRRGMRTALDWKEFDFIGYLDADLSTPLREMHRLTGILQSGSEVLLVMGSRVRRLGAEISRNPVRHYLGRVFATVSGLMMPVKAYDTQCGAKIFRRELVAPIFGEPFVSKWFFDLEILKRIASQIDHPARVILEVPLNKWVEKGDSKIGFADFLRAPIELVRIYKHYAGQST